MESLVGNKGKKLVVAFIFQLREGEYFLEDDSGRVPVNLAKAVSTHSVACSEYCRNSLQGFLLKDVLFWWMVR